LNRAGSTRRWHHRAGSRRHPPRGFARPSARSNINQPANDAYRASEYLGRP
jgi:hypothetical protein